MQAVPFYNIKNILVVRLRFIGDVLLLLPTLRALKTTFPKSRISVLVNPGTGQVLENNPLVDEIIECPTKNYFGFYTELRRRNFDLAVNPTPYDRGVMSCFLSGARYRLGPDPEGKGFLFKKYFYTHLSKPVDPLKHKLEQFLDVVKDYGINTTDLSFAVSINSEEKQFADNFLSSNNISSGDFLVHCHPVGSIAEKRWRADRMAASIDYLDEIGARMVITSSNNKDDLEQISEIKKHLKSKPIFLVGQTTIHQVAALTARSKLYFGLDSGVMHIAAGMGTPCVALFGSSAAIQWHPYGEQHITITDQPLDVPFVHPTPTPEDKSPFLEKLDVETVKEALDRKLRKIEAANFNLG